MRFLSALTVSCLIGISSSALAAKAGDTSANDASPGVTLAAYYFPNYHPGDSRNRVAKGEGWSEWELVKEARPRFPGHQQPRVPLWGYEDESDPRVMERKIQAAADHGIDAFIFDWYYYDDGPFLEKAIDEGYLGAENNDRVKFALMWANHDWLDIHPYKKDTPYKVLYPGRTSQAGFRQMTRVAIHQYFSQPSYWRIDGKPYFSIYEINTLMESFGSVEATRNALDQFREDAKQAGLPGLHLNAVIWGTPVLPTEKTPVDPAKIVNELGFDSVTSYVWIHHVPLNDRETDFNWVKDQYMTYWERAATTFDVPYYPNLSVGWDSSPRAFQEDEFGNTGYPFTNLIVNNPPERFGAALNEILAKARTLSTAEPIITINCWNEWTEGSYLEPDTTYGLGYLEAIRNQFSPALTNTVELPAPGAIHPFDLQCEHLADPVGIDAAQPRLSWKLAGTGRDQSQTAFQIVVASSPALLSPERADLWDSGVQKSDRNRLIPYSGAPLRTPGQTCFWRVRVWDDLHRASDWSEPGEWTMAAVGSEPWSASWILAPDDRPLLKGPEEFMLRPALYFRKEFAAERPIRKATIFATALGNYHLSLNGADVTEARFLPGWADYHKRNYYNTFDVTHLIQQGDNALGAILVDGWYAGYLGFARLVAYGPNRCGRFIYGKDPALMAQLRIEYADGTTETLGTDPTWKVTDIGPIRQADILMGEAYDANHEMPGWDTPGFDDSGWDNPISGDAAPRIPAEFTDPTGTRTVDLGFKAPPVLQAYHSVPIRATESITPVAVTEPSPGVHIYDLGQNISGVVALRVQGEQGTRVTLRFGEGLHQDGTLMTENLRKARATDYYTLRGTDTPESWTPLFTYPGFRYVEVSGLPYQPKPEDITGIVIHSDTPLVSHFTSSDPMANQLFQNVVWTQRANFFEAPTDCPQRDERLGWTGDAQIYVGTAARNADVAAFFSKWLTDLEEAQLPDGAYPDYAPHPYFHGSAKQTGATAWMDAGIICPYNIYLAYGDEALLQRLYPSMQRFMQFRRDRSPDFLGVEDGNTWGDWLALDESTPIPYIDTAYFAITTQMMSEIAKVLGKDDDARMYREWMEQIRAAFADEYLLPSGGLNVQTQTAHVLALQSELLPESTRLGIVENLAAMIEARGWKMATGFLGTRPILPVLSAFNRHDLACRLFQSRAFPSWGYEIVNGATTIWERWNSYTVEGGYGNAAMNSFSHYAFGAVCEWMFETLAGIAPVEPAYTRIRIRPMPPSPDAPRPEGAPPLDWVKASFDSPMGVIASQWRRSADSMELVVTVPPNTTAEVCLPTAAAPSEITEGGKPLDQTIDGVHSVSTRNGEVLAEVGSGTYFFTMPTP